MVGSTTHPSMHMWKILGKQICGDERAISFNLSTFTSRARLRSNIRLNVYKIERYAKSRLHVSTDAPHSITLVGAYYSGYDTDRRHTFISQ